MAIEKPVRVLDLYCGDSAPLPAALRKRFAGTPVEYVGIDSLGRRSFERNSPTGGIVRHQYIDAVIEPRDREKLEALLGRFPDGHFHEIHVHMPADNAASEDAFFRNRLSRLLARGGRLFATIQSEGSPLFDFKLQNLSHASADEREAFLENRGNLERAAEESGLRIEHYGANSSASRRWITREKDLEAPNDRKQSLILEALKRHSASAAFANHFVVFRRVR